jgi:rRNA maturation endonuclease Nob1
MSGSGEREGLELVVLRCGSCGDTFPANDDAPICPSCGGTDLHPATEPLL